MGYYDGLSAGSFKKTDDGKTVFYPWGAIGKGYVLESEEQEKRFRNWVNRLLMVSLPAAIVFSQIFTRLFGYLEGLALAIPILLVYGFVYHWRVKNLTNGLQVSNVKMTIAEAQKNSALAHSWGTIVFGGIASIGFVLLGVWIFVDQSDFESKMVALAIIGFFGICAFASLKMILKKRKQ